MKKSLLASATILALTIATPALAEHHDHGGSIPPGAAAGGAADSHHHGGSSAGVTVTSGGAENAATGGTHRHDRSGFGGTNPFTGRTATGGPSGGSNATGGIGRDGGTHYNNGVTVFAPHTHWGRSGHNGEFDALRRSLNATHRFHRGTYYRPNGWYARNWRYGEFLPSIFYSQQYWIDDYGDFDLDVPPAGTVWVRYGNDALLIDEDTGEIIEAVYGLFY